MTVKFPKFLQAQWRRAAKAAFPREEYAILIGHRGDNCFEITELYFPEDRAKFCTSVNVDTQDHWWEEAQALIEKEGTLIIGDIHSHPDATDLSPSFDDWAGAWWPPEFLGGKKCIMGISTVRQTKRGRYCRTVFHPYMAPLKVKTV